MVQARQGQKSKIWTNSKKRKFFDYISDQIIVEIEEKIGITEEQKEKQEEGDQGGGYG